MKRWNESRSARLTALALVLPVFAACDDDTTGVPDPVEQAQTLETLTEQFFTENEGVQTLNVLAPLIAGVGFDIAPTLSVINLREPGLRQFADNVKATHGYGWANGSGAELMAGIPVGLQGTVWVINPQTLQYEFESNLGPANGVRFILYAVDPVFAQLVIPLVEVGALDIIDTSQLPTINVQMIVDIGGSTVLDISTTATGDETSFSVSAEGFIAGDGAQLDIEFSLDASFTNETDFDLTSDLTLSSGGFTVTADLSLSATATTADASVSLMITAPDGSSISFDIDIDDTTGDVTGTVSFGSDVVAIITADAEGTVTITNAEGGDLTQAQLEALGAILEGFFEVFAAAFGIVGLIFIILGFAFL